MVKASDSGKDQAEASDILDKTVNEKILHPKSCCLFVCFQELRSGEVLMVDIGASMEYLKDERMVVFIVSLIQQSSPEDTDQFIENGCR